MSKKKRLDLVSNLTFQYEVSDYGYMYYDNYGLEQKKNHDFDRVIGNDDNYPLNYEGDTFSNNTLRIVASNKQDNNVILDRETSRVETEIAKSELTRNVMIFSLSDTATFDLNNSTIKGSTSNLSLFIELRGTDSEGKQHKYEVNVNYGFSSDFTEINQVQNIIFPDTTEFVTE